MKPVYINKISSFDYKIEEYEGIQVAKIADPDYKSIITNANMRRRMSRIIKMGVASALNCLGDDKEIPLDAIITATGWGCLEDTEKFLADLIKYDEGSLNPTTFIQSTFNTIGSQIALLLNAKPYNMTYVHRGLSMESALLDACLYLKEGKKNILVGGFDELTGTSFQVLKRLGVYENNLGGEGVNFFLLSSEKSMSTQAKLLGLATFTGCLDANEISLHIHSFLEKHQLNAAQISLLGLGKSGKSNFDQIYDDVKTALLIDQVDVCLFKNKCGEYPTAMAFGLAKIVKELGLNYSEGNYSLLLNISEATGVSMTLIQR